MPSVYVGMKVSRACGRAPIPLLHPVIGKYSVLKCEILNIVKINDTD